MPTVTTTLAGFGLWVDKLPEHEGAVVIRRDDYNDHEAEQGVADALARFARLDGERLAQVRRSACEISRTALWERLFSYYERAYAAAVENSVSRTNRVVLDDGGTRDQQINFVRQQLFVEKPKSRRPSGLKKTKS